MGVCYLYEETFDGSIKEKFEIDVCLWIRTLSVSHCGIALKCWLLVDDSFRWASRCSVLKYEPVCYLAC